MAVFVGREKEMETLTTALNDAGFGRGKFFLITGETGIGKTHLLQEFATLSIQHGALVLQARCNLGDAPYSPVEHALQKSTQTSLEPLPIGLSFSHSEEKAAESLARAKTMVLERFLRRFEEIAAGQTCVFMVDDIQWADTGTLNFLHYLSRNLAKLRMVVVCAYGSEYTTVENNFTQFLRNLNIERNIRTITLEKLTSSQTAKIVCELLATWKIHKKVLDTIYKKTGGNPFFVEEV